MGDIQFLKKYVQSHPDNRMGWYLLGKEYAATGQQGKANYCFNQAGDVYEAFEHTQIPAKWLLEAAERERQHIEQQRKRAARRKWSAVLFMLLLLSCIVGAPGAELPDLQELQPAISVVKPESTSIQPIVYLIGDKDGANGALEKTVTAHMIQGSSSQKAIVVELEQRGLWLLWSQAPRILAELQEHARDTAMPSKRTYDIQVYDPDACGCTPEVPTATETYIGSWMTQIEEIQSLRSAVIGYQQINNKKPAQISDLTASYPKNVMAGETPNMPRLFTPLRESPTVLGQNLNNKHTLEETIARTTTETTAETTSASSSGLTVNTNAASAQLLFTEPFKIVVDKKNHRLAVVSGRVIWRSYEVGLGGDKTPEETFQITEKVKNPNGKSNGEFGSRGMALSDTRYAIHGTDEPASIGKDQSHGCIRMRQQDIEELFDMVPLGTKVIIKDSILPDDLVTAEQPFKVTPQRGQIQTNPHKVYKWLG